MTTQGLSNAKQRAIAERLTTIFSLLLRTIDTPQIEDSQKIPILRNLVEQCINHMEKELGSPDEMSASVPGDQRSAH